MMKRIKGMEELSQVWCRVGMGKIWSISRSTGLVALFSPLACERCLTAWARGHERAGDMLRDVDIAMYQAKSAGKARYVMFDAAMQQEIVARGAVGQ